MLKAGLTGNIGSGKSTVARIFEAIGVPVFHADQQAKELYRDTGVRARVEELFGTGVFLPSGMPDTARLAKIVFTNPKLLKQLNSIIHPLVREKYLRWVEGNANKAYTLYEAAVLFESGYSRSLDRVVLVRAPEKLCIRRVMQRDGITREMVKQRMKNQWSETRKAEKADFVIINDGHIMVLPQVLKIHRELTMG